MMLRAKIREMELHENQHASNAKRMKLEILDLKEKVNSQLESQAVSDCKIQELLSQLTLKEGVENKMSEMEERLAGSENERAKQLIKYTGIEQTLESERESKYKLEEELTKLKEEHVSEIINYKKTLDDKAQQIVVLENSLELEAEAKKALETKLQNVQKTLKSENTDLKKAIATKEKRILKLEKSQLDLEKRTETVKKEFDEKSKHITELEAKKSAYLAKMIRENNENTKELVQVKQDLTKVNKEKKELEDRLSQIEKDYEMLKNYFRKLQQTAKENK
ncbi:hypothetical protein CAEBREN_01424 [Caenorhabditis brenneri]|uniref:Uncharacterized protein n=1 Tax=Caenorhabditis brenneri TaxID=135651 RepID=G0P2H7_CAEBE|nr:hypothetical protein CAEBREN_01424 [Caenorhabditis brenneri]